MSCSKDGKLIYEGIQRTIKPADKAVRIYSCIIVCQVNIKSSYYDLLVEKSDICIKRNTLKDDGFV